MACSPPGDLPDSGIDPRSPSLQVGSLPSEPPGKPMDTVVGSPSLLPGIFLTQELNRGLLHCRWIIYQLSYQGSPKGYLMILKNKTLTTFNPFYYLPWNKKGLPRRCSCKASSCQCRRHKRPRFDPWVGKFPWRRERQPTPVFVLGESYGQRSLEEYSPWGHKELGMTEYLKKKKSKKAYH